VLRGIFRYKCAFHAGESVSDVAVLDAFVREVQ